jgi:hypothetical protein
MAKKKAGDAPAGETATGPMTKMDAVRAALEQGVEKPTEGVAFIKDKFGLEISAQMFSAYKSHVRKKPGRRGRRGRRAATAAPGRQANNGSPIELARAVKQLVERFGADSVVQMAGVFAE